MHLLTLGFDQIQGQNDIGLKKAQSTKSHVMVFGRIRFKKK
jgi:hypothetical protein